MNWLLIGLPLAGFYLVWFGFLLYKRKYNKPLLYFALAQLPYLLLNVVAPFRGAFDAEYAGYTMGWIQLPKGMIVPLVVGAIVISCFLLATKALSNKMNMKWWGFAFVVNLLLSIFAAFPVFLDVITNLSDFRLELGEYLQISGVWVALVIFLILVLPTFYACFLSGKKLVGSKQVIVE